MQKQSQLAWILLALLALIWGSSFILIKKGLTGLSSGEVGSLRIVAASFVLTHSAFRKLKNTKIEGKTILFLFCSGLLGSLIPSFLFAIAQTRLESAVTGILNALTPMFTIIIASLFFGQKQISKGVFAGLIMGFLGVVVLITANEDGNISGVNVYAFPVIAASLCYASNLNLIKTYLNNIHTVAITSISLALVGPIAAVHLFGFTDFLHKLANEEAIYLPAFYIFLLGVAGTAFALIIFNRIIQLTSPLFASSVTYIIPIVAVIWGLVDGERLYWMHYIGMSAVCLGVYITNFKQMAYKKNGTIR